MILTQFEEMYGDQTATLVVMPHAVRVGDQVELPTGTFTVKTVAWIIDPTKVDKHGARLVKLNVRIC